MQYRPEYDMKLIGHNLKRLREEKKFTVEEVRRYLRLGSVQAIYKYEAGKSYPPVDTMFALMQMYEAEPDDIICGYGKSTEVIKMNMMKEKQFKRLESYHICHKEHTEKKAG